MKDLRDWIAVRKLHEKGVPIKQIARDLKMSKNTVKKLIKAETEPEYTRETTCTKIDDYKDIVRIWYLDKNYNFNGTRIFNELYKKGYSGTINPVYRYLRSLKAERNLISRRATIRCETPPGEQAQFDWGEYQIVVAGEKITIYCFSMILSYSRKKAAICSKSANGVAIYEAIQDLFMELGGVTKELIIDNPKALVIAHKKGEEIDFNESALKLSAYIGTELNACIPMRPRTKGKIEKPFQYIEEQFIKGNSFEDMDKLNQEIKKFMHSWNNKTHGTTGRNPDEMYQEEAEFLKKLYKKKVIDTDLEIRKVSTDSFVMIGTNKYSVPVKYVDRQLKIRVVYGYILEIYDFDLNLVKIYRVKAGKNRKFEDKEDYKDIAVKVPFSIPEIRRVFEKTFKHGSQFYALASRVTRQPHFHAREFLKLRDLYEINDLDIILEHCITNNILKIDDIKSLIKEKYFELIVEHEKVELSLSKSTKNKYIINNEKEIVRHLSYYGNGGQNWT